MSRHYFLYEKPKKINLDLMSDEIENIIQCLQRQPHDQYLFFDYSKIIKKMRKSLK